MDPRLSDQSRIVIKEVMHHGPRLGRPAAPVLLEPRLYFSAYHTYMSLVAVPAPVCLNHVINELPGLWCYPCQLEVLPLR